MSGAAKPFWFSDPKMFQPSCTARSPMGFYCTEDPGHDGDHRADDPEFGSWAVWPQ